MDKQKLIDEIITMVRYDIQNEDEPKEFENHYRHILSQIDIQVLQDYIDEKIDEEEFYEDYISKVE